MVSNDHEIEDEEYRGGYPLQWFVDVFQNRVDPREPLTTSEVAEEIECSHQTAYTKLKTLVEHGALKTKKLGARARVWWL